MGKTFHAIKPIGYSVLTLTSSTTAVDLSSASPAMNVTAGTVGGKTVRRALMTVEDATIRWRADGTDPTSSEGHELADTDILTLVDANYEELLKKLHFINTDGTTVYVRISFFD